MHFHFIGIGGIGMSALARKLKKEGHYITGYDAQPTPLTQTLQKEGIKIYHQPDYQTVAQADKIIFTPAIPETFQELQWAKELQKPLTKRAHELAEQVNKRTLIAVAGTHGKTSVSALIAHLLYQTIGCEAYVGGIMKNYTSNFLFSRYAQWAIAEADEYNKSFLALNPTLAVVTSIDWDYSCTYANETVLIAINFLLV